MSLENVITLDVDIKKLNYFIEPTVTANDRTVFVINLKDDDFPINLADVSTITLVSKRLDGRSVITPGVKGLIIGHQVVFELGNSETAVNGRVSATVQLYDYAGRVSSIAFGYIVKNDPSASYLLNVGEITLIQIVLEEGPLRIKEATDAAIAANEAVDNVEAKIIETDAVIVATETVKNDTLIVKDATQLVKDETLTVKNDTLLVKAEAEAATIYTISQGDYAKAEADRLVGTDVSVLDNELTTFKSETTAQLAENVRVTQSKNIFNKNTVEYGKWLNKNNGDVIVFAGYFLSIYIPVLPSTSYYLFASNPNRRVIYYDVNKAYLGFSENTSTLNTPPNTAFIRYSSGVEDLPTSQIELGTTLTKFEDTGVKVSVANRSKIYTLNDAWAAWSTGKKFPVAFFGDSTFEGIGTTGFVSPHSLGSDYNTPNAFPVKLQTILRNATGNQTLRIYNSGHAGRTASWGLSNVQTEFGTTAAYGDTKMVGIGWGINERISYTDIGTYREQFKMNIIKLIEWFYDRGIQPFLLTTQAIVEPGVGTTFSAYPLRNSEQINSVANEVKRELAYEFRLELIDVNKWTEMFLLYSAHSVKNVISDQLHFGDIGHQYEAELLFSEFFPATIYTNSYTRIDYSSQRIKNSVPQDWLTLPYTPTDMFKVFVNRTKADTTDMKLMTVYVFNTANKKLTLKGYKSDINSLTYVKINDVIVNVDTLEKTLGTLELGLHKLEVYSGVSTIADFKGFTVE